MAKDSNTRTAEKAMKSVKEYERNRGRKLESARGSGYDLISRGKGGSPRRIEVKGTKKRILVIPDMHETEFDKKQRLKATHLYVVADIYRRPTLYIVSRAQLARAIRATGKGLKKLIKWRVREPVQKRLRVFIKEEVL